MRKPIAITVGDPAGIGPDILLALLQNPGPAPLVILADPVLLQERARQLQLPFDCPLYTPKTTVPICVLPIPLAQKSVAGKPDPQNSPSVLTALKRAVSGCLAQEFSALVTGPVNKAVINDAGIPFSGHTGYLAELTNVPKAVMLFVRENLRLALITTHIPLADVAKHITREQLHTTLTILRDGLKRYFSLPNPRFAVAGLNPHAGENGYLGQEEITTMIPALEELRAQHFDILGPLAADTIFMAKADVIVSMYHDQSLPVLKTLGFGDIVNVTLGLPIIRTSVDHGTAFELAGTGRANPLSLQKAIDVAAQMIENTHDL